MASVITLALEASTYAGSSALLRGDRLVAERSVAMRGREHEALMPAVAELLVEQDVVPSEIGRVVCGAGPGSFTSLRIVGAIAKGIALAAVCPLIPISSLALLVASREPVEAGRYLAVLDALRGEHYVGLFEVTEAGETRPLGPELRIPSGEIAERALQAHAHVVGPGAPAERVTIPRAGAVARLASMLAAAPEADLATWEPAYGRQAEAQVKWEAAHGRALEVT
jgi:tRNA threonylcarbamoyladenosine biosynthesis protein TsaB